jgi:hypothetical protein
MSTDGLYIRDRKLVTDYINRQLVGPYDGEAECLYNDHPTQRYLMGTLYPKDTDLDSNDNGQDVSTSISDVDEIDDSPLSMVFQFLPASMGVSFYAEECNEVEICVWGGCYIKVKDEDIEIQEQMPEEERSFKQNMYDKWPKWVRRPLASETSPHVVSSSLNFSKSQIIPVLENRAQLHIIWRPMGKGSLITVTIMNVASHNKEQMVDPEECLFQVGFKCSPVTGSLCEYPSVNRLSYDREEEELALQYRNNITYAVGHGCAATWSKDIESPKSVQTVSMPTCEVKPVTTSLNSTYSDAEDVLSLQFLSHDDIDIEILENKLLRFIEGYSEWLKNICDEEIDSKFDGAKTRITGRINHAIIRMKAGVSLLVKDEKVRMAFSMANGVMLKQMIHSRDKLFGGSVKDRDQIKYVQPDYNSMQYSTIEWRPFQLAYQLLVLDSLVDSDSNDRNSVDLLWFPTGGGKTEAYLGLAAFELIHRRLKFGEQGAGTSVIKRYTLRLLTTQQFQRAATLICSLEIKRKLNSELLGDAPFTLGLWVGEASSPNKYTSEKNAGKGSFELYSDMLEEDKPENPFQLQQCPWCGTKIIPDTRTNDKADFGVRVTQTSFVFYCPSSTCELHERIPVTVVDEDIYANPPSFIIGTVDKFARLAWDQRAAGLFGNRVLNHRPPSLIIQDELHLISGPLGTISGIYEAAIETVIECNGIRPKIIAATATIRRAGDQVERLYGSNVCIFPPPGISSDDSYFARTDTDASGRLYLGVMAQGHSPMTSEVHTSAALSQSVIESNLCGKAKDIWWTQVIYHNSRRELGKTMTLARDDIPERVKVISSDEDNLRKLTNVEELSGNVRGIEIPEVLSRLELDCTDNNAIDILPCTNMISVGVDVSRLGLMLILGQPKTTAEYIQASSRVGRNKTLPPGIVVTLYSASKPRDRSHFENFKAYHEALYRAVEPTSVTPFSPPARKRALHAALVILMRHAGGLGENSQASLFDPQDSKTKRLIAQLVKRMSRAEPAEAENIQRDMNDIINDWVEKIDRASDEGRPLRYINKGGRQFSSLLKYYGEHDKEGWPTLNSMRNVDAEALIGVSGEK